MKILRIRFQNLNSLAFGEIDLENGPLAGTGLFAITGPTGAGKSTILDAITLALYGRAARYANTPNPADMMSRHTGECQAEVLFEVPRGRFLATWHLSRSRRKPDAAIQPAKRRVIDAQGVVLAQSVKSCDEQIEALTGLNCERFLRSVLLAQGEFSKFLKAPKDERAALLESLTGTQIYSDLSILAFEEATERERALLQKRGALEQIVLLTGEERAAHAGRIEAFTQSLALLTGERDALAKRIDRGRQLAALLTRESETAQKQTALAREKESAADALHRLARHRLAQPFFPDLQTLDDLARRAARDGAEHDHARAAAATALTRVAAGVHAACEFGEALVARAETALRQERDETAACQRKLAELDRWLAEHTAEHSLETALPQLAERLAGLANARRLQAQGVDRGKALALDAHTATARVATLQTDRAGAEAQQTESAAETAQAASALGALLKGRTPDALLADARALEAKETALGQLRILMDKRDAVAAEGLTIADDETRLMNEIETARAQKLATASEAEAQAKLLELTRDHLALLEKIAGYEDQRAQLAPGHACPLCGGLEHPFAQPGAEPSASIQEARRNLARAKVADAAAVKEAQLATQQLAATEEALKGLQKRRAQLRQIQTADHEAFEKLGKSLHIYTMADLEKALEGNTRARADHEALLHAVREAQARHNAAELAHVKRQAQATRLAEALAGEQKALERLETQIAETTAAVRQGQAEIDAHLGELAPALAPFAIPAPPSQPGAETQTRLLLEERHQHYRKTRRDREQLDAGLKQAALRIEALERQAAEQRKWARKTADLQTLDALNAAPVDRDLAGRLRREWATLEAAETALAELRSQWTQAAATAEERRKTRADVEAAAARQSTEIRKRLAAAPGLPFAEAEALRAARLPDEEAARIEQRERDLASQTQTLTGELAQLRAQVHALREASAPEGADLDALALQHAGYDAKLTETTEQRTTLKNELARDDRNRQTQAEQAAALEEERQRLAVWNQLRGLIGSHDGAKFRQFAQGLSLDVLLRHANRHLRRLCDRYQLQRVAGGELALEIVDLHQASVARPMQSLSGGESFLASLALALGLSDLAGRNVRIDSLFIDEGFGSLDAETLDLAIAALDTLRLNHKTVGVISHVELLKERIPVQIRVEKLAGGRSVLHLPG